MPMTGGVGAELEATEEVQALCDQLREDIQARANEGGHEGQFQEFVAVKHKTQV